MSRSSRHDTPEPAGCEPLLLGTIELQCSRSMCRTCRCTGCIRTCVDGAAGLDHVLRGDDAVPEHLHHLDHLRVEERAVADRMLFCGGLLRPWAARRLTQLTTW